MKSITTLFYVVFLLSLVSAIGQQDVFVITLNYDSENISLGSVEIIQGIFYPPASISQEAYNLTIYSIDNEVLYSQRFNFPLQRNFMPSDPSWFDGQGNQISYGSGTISSSAQFTTLEIIVPYFENAAFIKIIDRLGTEVLTIPINGAILVSSEFAVINNSAQAPCILIECIYAPKTCPKWGTQDKTCVDSCTKKKTTHKVICTPVVSTELQENVSFWRRISNWFKNIFI